MKNQPPDDRFDEKAKKVVSKGGFLADVGEDDIAIDFDTDVIKQFLHSEIDLALEQAAKAVESIIFDNEGNTKNGTAPSILINPHKYADLQTWNYVLTSAADIIRELKNK